MNSCIAESKQKDLKKIVLVISKDKQLEVGAGELGMNWFGMMKSKYLTFWRENG